MGALSNNELITVRQASEQTGMSIPRILRRIRSGKIRAKKLGWIWAIPKDELKNL
jgi:excisionase family DNA binding protein